MLPVGVVGFRTLRSPADAVSAGRFTGIGTGDALAVDTIGIQIDLAPVQAFAIVAIGRRLITCSFLVRFTNRLAAIIIQQALRLFRQATERIVSAGTTHAGVRRVITCFAAVEVVGAVTTLKFARAGLNVGAIACARIAVGIFVGTQMLIALSLYAAVSVLSADCLIVVAMTPGGRAVRVGLAFDFLTVFRTVILSLSRFGFALAVPTGIAADLLALVVLAVPVAVAADFPVLPQTVDVARAFRLAVREAVVGALPGIRIAIPVSAGLAAVFAALSFDAVPVARAVDIPGHAQAVVIHLAFDGAETVFGTVAVILSGSALIVRAAGAVETAVGDGDAFAGDIGGPGVADIHQSFTAFITVEDVAQLALRDTGTDGKAAVGIVTARTAQQGIRLVIAFLASGEGMGAVAALELAFYHREGFALTEILIAVMILDIA